jgi:hypothetical protein
MLRELLRPIVIFPLFVILVVVLVLVHSTKHESAGTGASTSPFSGNLNVSQDGSQTTTNVSGADLQQAAPPASSITNSGATPQQAVPSSAQ